MKTIWLDTDPGFDDWMAWALLEAEPGVRMLGVSTVAGNAPLAMVTDHARRLHALHGWRTPLWAGADQPLVQPQKTAHDVIQALGLRTSGASLPARASALEPGDGVEALLANVRANPGRVTLVAIGPLTNVALALRRAPELPALLADLVIMGGSLGTGNVTPVAEFNIWADPEAAAEVFAQAAAVDRGRGPKLFGIEVCRQVQAGDAEIAAVRALGGERAAIFADHFDGYVALARRRGRPTSPMYDPTPVAWLAHPEWFELKPSRVEVELDGRHTRGMTVCDFRVPHRVVPNAHVAVSADGPRVMAWCLERLLVSLRPEGR